MLLRASICAITDNACEVDLAESWLRENRAHLSYVSDMNGCGCCIFLWDIEGPSDVVKTIPAQLVSGGEWASSGTNPKG
ncbi:MAG: hypothetical protein JWR14_90 [Caballeronia sp.]|jgi:hypothetical protein|nr:hypothetical protein [Caballeronia sp.]